MNNKLVQLLSNLFHPLLSMPWAAVVFVLFTPLSVLPTSLKFQLVGEVLLFSFLLPALSIVALSSIGIVKNGVALRDRKDRVIPLFLQFVFCVLQAIILGWQGLQMWVVACFWGGSLITFIFFIVTFWWKISGHAAGNAALAFISLLLYFWFPNVMPLYVPILAILLTGAIGSIRIYLQRHTLAQVAVGSLTGVLCMALAYWVLL